jgi:putative flippase GtrA
MSIARQFATFSAIGAAATALHYLILIILVQSGAADVITASSIGFALSAAANYALNRQLTFSSQRAHAEALPRFAAVACIGLGLNAALVWLFHAPLGLHYLLAQIAATGGTLLWNFVLNRIWTFPGSGAKSELP